MAYNFIKGEDNKKTIAFRRINSQTRIMFEVHYPSKIPFEGSGLNQRGPNTITSGQFQQQKVDNTKKQGKDVEEEE